MTSKASILEALECMLEHDIRDIIIEKDDNNDIGILSDADIIRLKTEGVDFSCPIRDIRYRHVPQAPRQENILEAMHRFSDEDDYICVMGDHERLFGIVSYTDIVTNIDPRVLIEQQRVGDLITRNVIQWVKADDLLANILDRLHNVSDALVVGEDEKAVGVITTKDAMKVIRDRQDIRRPVSVYMSTPLKSVPSDITIREAIDFIGHWRFKRIFVHDSEENLLGMISQRELVTLAYAKWSDILTSQVTEMEELIGLLKEKTHYLERQATTDNLTGLANRAHFETVLNEEIQRFKRYGREPFSLIILDLDRFKQLNDSQGHIAGDKALRMLADMLKENSRDVDLVARWGGDEFVILLPNTPCDGAKLQAGRFCEAFNEACRPEFPLLSVSAGTGEYARNESLSAFFIRADKDLYKAKNRNKSGE